jgi:flagellar biosynthesis protein
MDFARRTGKHLRFNDMNEKRKRRKAVAVTYNPLDKAPQVIAKGHGRIAEKIIEKSQASDVPLYEDAQLADDLTRLDYEEYIPPELYDVVAQILLFISDLDKKGRHTVIE